MINLQISTSLDLGAKESELMNSLLSLAKPVFDMAGDVMGDYTNAFGLTLTIGGGFLMWLIIAQTMGAGKQIGAEPPAPTPNNNEQSEEEAQKKKKEEEEKKKREQELEQEQELERQMKEKEEREKEEEEIEKKITKEQKLEIEKSEKEKEDEIKKQEKKSKEQRNELQDYRLEKQANNKLVFDWNKNGMSGVDTEKSASTAKLKDQMKENLSTLGLLMSDLTNLMNKGLKNNEIAQQLSQKANNIVDGEQLIQTIEAIREFINVANKDSINFGRTAINAVNQGNINVAIEALNKNMSKDMTNTDASKNASLIGTLAFLNDDKALAIDAFNKAVELAPSNVGAWGRLGDTYLTSGFGLEAEQSYSKVLTFGTKEKHTFQMGKAFEKLGAIQGMRGNKAEAVRLTKEAKKYYQKLGLKTALNNEEKFALNQIKQSNQMVGLKENTNDYIMIAEKDHEIENKK